MHGLKGADALNARSQFLAMHYGVVTEEMEYVAKREKISAELVRDEVARGPRDYSRQYPSSQSRAHGHRCRVQLQN
jgi:thiamine biosynthesis protein ThiC